MRRSGSSAVEVVHPEVSDNCSTASLRERYQLSRKKYRSAHTLPLNTWMRIKWWSFVFVLLESLVFSPQQAANGKLVSNCLLV